MAARIPLRLRPLNPKVFTRRSPLGAGFVFRSSISTAPLRNSLLSTPRLASSVLLLHHTAAPVSLRLFSTQRSGSEEVSKDGLKNEPTVESKDESAGESKHNSKEDSADWLPDSSILRFLIYGVELLIGGVVFITATGGAFILFDTIGLCDFVHAFFLGTPLNEKSFSEFTVVKKEQISDSNFVVTIQPTHGRPQWAKIRDFCRLTHTWLPWGLSTERPWVFFHWPRFLLDTHTSGRVLEDAWRHGQWSVEIKQPQLQIVREYTPLPPRHGQEQAEYDLGQLRFLVRKVDGGEVSTYLSRLEVGDEVELRGPHLGVAVEPRLGDEGNVLFVAGGTGIAPALQIVRTVLDRNVFGDVAPWRNGRSSAKTDNVAQHPQPRRKVSIIWANRQRDDCRGCEAIAQFSAASSRTDDDDNDDADKATIAKRGYWSTFWDGKDGKDDKKDKNDKTTIVGPIMAQLAEIKRRHGDNFSLQCTVDKEMTFIDAPTILERAQSLTRAPTKSKRRETFPLILPLCPWHLQDVVARTTGQDPGWKRWEDPKDITNYLTHRSVFGSQGPWCTCDHERNMNLAVVSGPDGFVSALAGPKTWVRAETQGHEVQGPLGGMIGNLWQNHPDLAENWIVLKL